MGKQHNSFFCFSGVIEKSLWNGAPCRRGTAEAGRGRRAGLVQRTAEQRPGGPLPCQLRPGGHILMARPFLSASYGAAACKEASTNSSDIVWSQMFFLPFCFLKTSNSILICVFKFLSYFFFPVVFVMWKYSPCRKAEAEDGGRMSSTWPSVTMETNIDPDVSILEFRHMDLSWNWLIVVLGRDWLGHLPIDQSSKKF